jgi:hypothetical protein
VLHSVDRDDFTCEYLMQLCGMQPFASLGIAYLHSIHTVKRVILKSNYPRQIELKKLYI